MAYESEAARWVERERGMRILARNFGGRSGEIDIVALDAGQLAFIEVRARSNPRFSGAAASVDHRKQRRLLMTAQLFLQRHPTLANLPCRFDVIAFEPPQSGTEPRMRWIRGAFTA
jgi:putative endonuclease